MHEFCMGDFIGPGARIGSTEDSLVGLDLLVDSFSLFIRLRVVGSGEGEVIV